MPASVSTAATLTREQVQSILIQPLEQASVFLAAGPRIFDTDGSPVRIPKLTDMDAPAFIGENTEIPDVDATFDEVTLLPSTMKSVKSLTKFSNELARQTVIALDAALRERMVRDVATKLDHAFINGDGGSPAGTEPEGLLHWSGTTEVNAATGPITLDALLDAVGAALDVNVDLSRLRWMMPARDWVAIRRLKDQQDRYQLTPDPTQDTGYRLLGYPVTITNRIPTNGGTTTNESTIILADFSQIAVARDVAPSVTILDQTFGDFDQQAIRVVARYDVAPMNPEAVCLLRGVTPAPPPEE